MKIERNVVERSAQYLDLVDQCFASRTTRMAQYDMLANYYMWGSTNGEIPVASKIFSHIDTVTSFLYSGETTRFTVELGQSVPANFITWAEPMKAHLHDHWHDSQTDVIFDQALKWALVWGSTFLYPVWRGKKLVTYVIRPHEFGVLREDSMFLSRQEAFSFKYWVTRSQLQSDLRDHPRRDEILKSTTAAPKQQEGDTLPAAVQGIIATTVSPNVQGVVESLPMYSQFGQPVVTADMIEMNDLWVFDDDLGDWRRVTTAQNITVYDRQNTSLPRMGDKEGMHPFTQICPNPNLTYFWGDSEIVHLIRLQERWGYRYEQISRLLDKMVDPPKLGLGFDLDTAELRAALNSPSGFAAVPEIMGGTAKLETMAPTISQDVWHDLDFLDREFAAVSGIAPIMKGQGEAGVRSRGQTDTLARLGSARTKKRAMIVEDSLDNFATVAMRLIQRNDPTKMLVEEEGKQIKFVAAQFPDDYTCKVDAHSMSPIFMEDAKQTAFSLAESHAIDRESLLEMTQPPNLQLLKHRLKKIEAKEAQQAQMEQQQEAQGGGGVRRVK